MLAFSPLRFQRANRFCPRFLARLARLKFAEPSFQLATKPVTSSAQAGSPRGFDESVPLNHRTKVEQRIVAQHLLPFSLSLFIFLSGLKMRFEDIQRTQRGLWSWPRSQLRSGERGKSNFEPLRAFPERVASKVSSNCAARATFHVSGYLLLACVTI